MATLLRKVWESVSNRSYSTSNSATHRPIQITTSSYSTITTTSSYSSLGALFDEIPLDILVQIVKLVGPKDAVKLSCVSRAWRLLVSDNRLWIYFLQNHHHDPWDTVFFVKLNLRSGYPIQFVALSLSFCFPPNESNQAHAYPFLFSHNLSTLMTQIEWIGLFVDAS